MELRVARRTDKATLVALPTGTREAWMPRSVADVANGTVGTTTTFSVPVPWYRKLTTLLNDPQPAAAALYYSTEAGMVLRDERGRSQPVTLDQVEQDFGQVTLDAVMSEPRKWHPLDATPAPLPILRPIANRPRPLDPRAWSVDPTPAP